jgi:hypothetical protein
MHQIQRHRVRGHGPEPLQHVLAIPGRFIDVTHWRLVSERGQQLIMRYEGLRHSIDPLLHRAQAHRNVPDRLAEVAHEAPGGSMQTRTFADAGTQEPLGTSALRSRLPP